jgi:peptide/nickel transport system permease protein
MTAATGLRAWLLTDSPASRGQARAGRFYRTWLAFRANRLAVLGLMLVLSLVFMAVFADVLSPYSPVSGGDLRTSRLLPPSAEHLFGTDSQARDIFSRILHGARLTLVVVALVAITSEVSGAFCAIIWISTCNMRERRLSARIAILWARAVPW